MSAYSMRSCPRVSFQIRSRQSVCFNCFTSFFPLD
jgi:hypothetical protein